MATKSNSKSNNQKRGGKRPGAGRPRGTTGGGTDDRRTIAIDLALAGLDHAMKAFDASPDDAWTPIQHRWHLAMVLFGVPLGILNSPALISVAKQSGQSAATIVGENVANMWSRFPVPCRRRGMWFCNEDAEAQLETLAGASGLALYMPAGTGGNPYPLLKGRPLIALEQCPALGAVGDIVLADLSQYVLIDNGVKSALSVHARFDTDEVVFRFVWRVDGKSAYSTPITPYNGSSTRSPFVCVAAR